MFHYPKRQDFSILPDQNMSQEAKCFNTPILYTTLQIPHFRSSIFLLPKQSRFFVSIVWYLPSIRHSSFIKVGFINYGFKEAYPLAFRMDDKFHFAD